jgi:hypothetical protein
LIKISSFLVVAGTHAAFTGSSGAAGTLQWQARPGTQPGPDHLGILMAFLDKILI